MELLIEPKRPGEIEDEALSSLADALASATHGSSVRVVGNQREPEKVGVSPWEAIFVWLVGASGAAAGNLASDGLKAIGKSIAQWAKKRVNDASDKRPVAVDILDDEGREVMRIRVDVSGHQAEITELPQTASSRPVRKKPTLH